MAKRTLKEIAGSKYNLAGAREQMGFTQGAYAEHIGVSQGTVCRWEQDETAPTLVRLYNTLYMKHVKKAPTRKAKKAKRLAVRAKLGALTPTEKAAQETSSNVTGAE